MISIITLYLETIEEMQANVAHLEVSDTTITLVYLILNIMHR